MNLSEKLQKVREKPNHVKERILIITMAVFIALVLTIWVTNFSFSGLNFKDTGEFFSNTKGYFSNPKGYIFDETMPEGLAKSLQSATSTNKSASTSTKVETSTTTDTLDSTSTVSN